MKRLARSALAVTAIAAVACARPPATLRVADGTPVVLISIDTLRADHLPVYGYQGIETPAIDALRRDSILYERAYSHTPLTLPSHASLFSGLYPGDHGVRDNVGYTLDPAALADGKVPYLPLALSKRGYVTGGAVSAFVLQARSGIGTGFDFFQDAIEMRTGTGLGGLQRSGADTLAVLTPWLRESAGRPLFAFFHLYEPHTPYEPPERFRSIASPYDGEIAAADALVGEFVAELRRLDLYDRAIVVLLSDHGEGLGEHGEDEHGLLLHREALQVPLLFKLPGGRHAGRAIAAPVGLVDVAPTLYALLGIPRPPAFAGRHLLGTLDPRAEESPRAIYSETFYPRLHFGWSELTSLVVGDRHLIEGPAPELYDLARDPQERDNRIAGERRVYGELRRTLAGFQRQLAPPAPVDAESRAALAALGYLGGGGDPAAGPLPDPKSQLPSLAQLKRGFTLMREKRWPEAERTFADLVAANPRMTDAWEFLGRSRVKLGRLDDALAAYQEALRRTGNAPHVAQNAASLLFDLGRLDDAAAHADLTMSAAPSFAHGLLARIALARRDLATAESEARAAIAEPGDRVLPRLVLAEVLHAGGRYEEALDVLAAARAAYDSRRAEDPDLLHGLHLLLGKVRADLGEAAAAEAEFGEEIRLFPDDPRPYSHLAVLQALVGRGAEAAATLRRMVETNPTPAAYAEAVRAYRALGDQRSASRLLDFARRKFPGDAVLASLSTGR